MSTHRQHTPAPCHPPVSQPEAQAAHGAIREASLCVLAPGAVLMEMLALQDSQPVDYETVNSECSFTASCLNVRLCAGCTSRAEILPCLYILSSLECRTCMHTHLKSCQLGQEGLEVWK